MRFEEEEKQLEKHHEATRKFGQGRKVQKIIIIIIINVEGKKGVFPS
jgi:hypothetical protein